VFDDDEEDQRDADAGADDDDDDDDDDMDMLRYTFDTKGRLLNDGQDITVPNKARCTRLLKRMTAAGSTDEDEDDDEEDTKSETLHVCPGMFLYVHLKGELESQMPPLVRVDGIFRKTKARPTKAENRDEGIDIGGCGLFVTWL